MRRERPPATVSDGSVGTTVGTTQSLAVPNPCEQNYAAGFKKGEDCLAAHSCN